MAFGKSEISFKAGDVVFIESEHYFGIGASQADVPGYTNKDGKPFRVIQGRVSSENGKQAIRSSWFRDLIGLTPTVKVTVEGVKELLDFDISELGHTAEELAEKNGRRIRGVDQPDIPAAKGYVKQSARPANG